MFSFLVLFIPNSFAKYLSGFCYGSEVYIEKINSDKVLTLEPHLAIFSGYADIDNFEMKNKYKFDSNTEAFDFAAKSLKGILTDCGYKEVDNCFIK